ncbi:MAG TPA: hypothetical protein VME45_18640 [Stellaceae bacterium]|nr:hypothetical protein [Stellaceae bacterium]
MRVWAAAALAVLLSMVAARADELQKAFDAVNAVLHEDRYHSGLVSLRSACPKREDNPWQFVTSSTVVFINETDRAILVDSGYCNGGNGSGQHLVIIQNGAAKVISDAGIEDMSFLAVSMYSEAGSLFLYGDRWLTTDPHCCPSKKATLEYNLKTHQHKFTDLGDNKP